MTKDRDRDRDRIAELYHQERTGYPLKGALSVDRKISYEFADKILSYLRESGCRLDDDMVEEECTECYQGAVLQAQMHVMRNGEPDVDIGLGLCGKCNGTGKIKSLYPECWGDEKGG